MPSFASSPFVLPSSILVRAFAPFFFFLFISASNDSLGGVEIELYAGKPLGIGRVRLDLPQDGQSTPNVDQRLTVTDSAGRVLYLTHQQPRQRKLLQSLLGVNFPQKLTYYFWFRGDDPLDLEIYTPQQLQVTAVPQFNQREYQKLVDEWWKNYEAYYSRVHRQAEYPIGVQTYLTAMWSARLQQPMPELQGFLIREHEQGGTILGKLFADEAYRAAVLRDLMLGSGDQTAAEYELPPHGVEVATATLPPDVDEIAIESIATHVPEECFYVRFGSFTNYLWFRNFVGRWRGDLGNMIVQRSIRRSGTDAISQQLGLRESKLSEVFGPQVIKDIAIVGLDTYFADGSSIGVLFEAKNSFLLGTSIGQQRSASAGEVPGANITNVKIAGKQVSYLSSPDGTLRSYYVKHDMYHFVTSSRALVERFLAVAEGDRPMSEAHDFLVARLRYPSIEESRAFVHLSSAFLKNLTSPAYRIELDRRLRSLESQRTLKLARFAAQQEALPFGSVEELANASLVPRDIAILPDGAVWQPDEKGQLYESVRGYRGRWLPIADNLPVSCTAGELRRYQEFSAKVTEEVSSLVPISAAISSMEPSPGIERIAVDVHLQRYSASNLVSLAKKLAPASASRVAPIRGDVLSVEVVLEGLLGGPPVHLFGGLRDSPVPLVIRGGGLQMATSIMEGIEGYIGCYPKPDFLKRLLPVKIGPYDQRGIARGAGLFDLWLRRADDFLLISFKERVLIEVGSQLGMVPAARPAQAWVMLTDLVGTKYQGVVSSFAYSRTRDTSASASRFMNALITQLHVPPADAKELADEFVGGEFVCPLGGSYELMATPAGHITWASTAAAPNNQFLLTEIPGDYDFPMLGWFRGMNAELVRDADSLTLSVLVDISTSEFQGEIVPPPAGEAVPPPAGEPIPAPEGEVVPPPAGEVLPPPQPSNN